MIIPKRYKFDVPLVFAVLALLLIGLLCLYSATRNAENETVRALFTTQILWIVLGLVLLGTIASVPIKFYYGFAYLIYAITISMLLYLEFTGGHVSKGAARWIIVGGFKIQPSEFVKIGLLLVLARHFTSNTPSLSKPSSLIAPAILMIVPFALVLKQPDLGTAMILGLVILPVLLWAGMPILEIFFLVSPFLSMILSFNVIPWGIYFLLLCVVLYFTRPSLGVTAVVVFANIATAGVTALAWNTLHDYQKNRIISFLDPSRDPFGAGYQIIQSKVAVGSGKLIGKGFLQGTQTKLSFLPEQHTDFIFSVFGEQFGFVGAVILILLYSFVLYRGLSVAKDTRNRFAGILCVGATSVLAFHVFINLAMTIGMMPVTGLPLPFLSYGGSFLATCMGLVGLILCGRKSAFDF